MKEIVIFVLLDAFRADYIYHTKFLRSLAESGLWGKMHEPFGFCPRSTYFGGLSPEDIGYTHMFIKSEERHPFRFVENLSSELTKEKSSENICRDLITSIASERSTFFEQQYLTIGQIPLEILSNFELSEKYAPWEDEVGYKSIFHELDEKNQSWMQCSWPFTNTIANVTDNKILKQVINTISPGHKFAYVHFSDLDHIGHRYGPESIQILEEIQRTDTIVEKLYNYCNKMFDSVHCVIIGDHGMLPVLSSINIYTHLDKTTLKQSIDYYMFIDSTMIRFWYSSDYVENVLVNVLSEIKGASIVNEEHKKKWRIEKCNKNNGQLILLANPGYVFIPNYFHEGNNLIKGMHGYEPENSDNSGIFLLNSSRQKICGRLPNNDARVVHSTLCDLLNLNAGKNEIPSALNQKATPSPLYISCEPENEEIKSVINENISVLINEATKRYDDIDAIILHGSYGRGEGQLSKIENLYKPVNDFDVLLIGKKDSKWRCTKELSEKMKKHSELPYYDIAFLNITELSKLNASIFAYDLLNGSRVVWGDKNIINVVPKISTEEIPIWDGFELILNRCAGIFNALTRYYESQEASEKLSSMLFLDNQIVKGWRSLGDWQLLKRKYYHSSYLRRCERINSLKELIGYKKATIDNITKSYCRKYMSSDIDINDLNKNLQQWYDVVIPTIYDSINALANKECNSLSECANVLGKWSRKININSSHIIRPNMAKRINAFKSIILLMDESFESILLNKNIDRQWLEKNRKAIGLWENYCH